MRKVRELLKIPSSDWLSISTLPDDSVLNEDVKYGALLMLSCSFRVCWREGRIVVNELERILELFNRATRIKFQRISRKKNLIKFKSSSLYTDLNFCLRRMMIGLVQKFWEYYFEYLLKHQKPFKFLYLIHLLLNKSLSHLDSLIVLS